MFDLGIWLKKLYTGSRFGNLGFIVYVHVRFKENFVGVWCLCQFRVLLYVHAMCVSRSSTIYKYYFAMDPPGLWDQDVEYVEFMV